MGDNTVTEHNSSPQQMPELSDENTDVLRQALMARRNTLLESIKTIDAEDASIQEEMTRKMEDARKRRQPLEDALSHLDAFLRIEGWLPTDKEGMAASNQQGANSKAATEAVYELLTTIGRPLHYRELAQQVIEKGIHLGGKDPAATLLSQMTRDGRFRRRGRGMYGLASSEARTPVRRRKKGRRHGSRRS